MKSTEPPDELLSLLTLTLLPKVDPVLARRLIRKHGSAKAVLRSSRSHLLNIRGVGQQLAETIGGWQEHVDPEKEFREMTAHVFCLAGNKPPSDHLYNQKATRGYDVFSRATLF